MGTPIDDQVSTIHTITVENNSGDKVEINITVADILANISYPSSDYTFIRNWTIDRSISLTLTEAIYSALTQTLICQLA